MSEQGMGEFIYPYGNNIQTASSNMQDVVMYLRGNNFKIYCLQILMIHTSLYNPSGQIPQSLLNSHSRKICSKSIGVCLYKEKSEN